MRIELHPSEEEPQIIKPETENIADEIRLQRKQLKGKGVKAYVQYFLDYYKWPTIAVIAVIIVIASFVRTQLAYVEPVLTAMMINTSSDGSLSEPLIADFMDHFQLDIDPESIVIDTSSYHSTGTGGSDVDTATQVKIMAQNSSDALDVIVADAYNYNFYAQGGTFVDLRTVLDDAQLKKYADRIFYVDLEAVKELDAKRNEMTYEDVFVSVEDGRAYELLESFSLPDPAAMKDPVPVGIMLNGSETFKKFGLYPDTASLLGFMPATKRREMAIKLMEYLAD